MNIIMKFIINIMKFILITIIQRDIEFNKFNKFIEFNKRSIIEPTVSSGRYVTLCKKDSFNCTNTV